MHSVQLWERGLPAKAACLPTHIFRMHSVQLWELACLRRRPASRPISFGCTRSNCGSWLACEGGLPANPSLLDALSPIVGARLAREGGLTADLSLSDALGPINEMAPPAAPCDHP